MAIAIIMGVRVINLQGTAILNFLISENPHVRLHAAFVAVEIDPSRAEPVLENCWCERDIRQQSLEEGHMITEQLLNICIESRH
jgi:hypothetical protein